jgi:hypothetical protein
LWIIALRILFATGSWLGLVRLILESDKLMNDPYIQWENLRKEIMQKIDQIDKDTPWTGTTEPDWWIQMMACRRAASSIYKR